MVPNLITRELSCIVKSFVDLNIVSLVLDIDPNGVKSNESTLEIKYISFCRIILVSILSSMCFQLSLLVCLKSTISYFIPDFILGILIFVGSNSISNCIPCSNVTLYNLL